RSATTCGPSTWRAGRATRRTTASSTPSATGSASPPAPDPEQAVLGPVDREGEVEPIQLEGKIQVGGRESGHIAGCERSIAARRPEGRQEGFQVGSLTLEHSGRVGGTGAGSR